MPRITDENAQAIIAFMDAFDLHITGIWPVIEKAMREEGGIDNPEEALEQAREALQR